MEKSGLVDMKMWFDWLADVLGLGLNQPEAKERRAAKLRSGGYDQVVAISVLNQVRSNVVMRPIGRSKIIYECNVIANRSTIIISGEIRTCRLITMVWEERKNTCEVIILLKMTKSLLLSLVSESWLTELRKSVYKI